MLQSSNACPRPKRHFFCRFKPRSFFFPERLQDEEEGEALKLTSTKKERTKGEIGGRERKRERESSEEEFSLCDAN